MNLMYIVLSRWCNGSRCSRMQYGTAHRFDHAERGLYICGSAYML